MTLKFTILSKSRLWLKIKAEAITIILFLETTLVLLTTQTNNHKTNYRRIKMPNQDKLKLKTMMTILYLQKMQALLIWANFSLETKVWNF
jgi:hypothetical protein